MKIGDRVELHPGTDDWMRGDRYGTVVGFGRSREYVDTFTKKRSSVRPVRVQLDKSGKVKRFHPENVMLANPVKRRKRKKQTRRETDRAFSSSRLKQTRHRLARVTTRMKMGVSKAQHAFSRKIHASLPYFADHDPRRPYEHLKRTQRKPKRVRKNPAGARIVHNKLLEGGWYVVIGPHQTPLNGRFDSKAEAEAYLRGDHRARRDAEERRQREAFARRRAAPRGNPSRGVHKGVGSRDAAIAARREIRARRRYSRRPGALGNIGRYHVQVERKGRWITFARFIMKQGYGGAEPYAKALKRLHPSKNVRIAWD